MSARCYLCASSVLEPLAAPGRGQSITTDGQLLPIAWDKRQCRDCGLLQSVEREAIAATLFSYEENYRFYDRPFMRAFEQGRYEAYAEWIREVAQLRPGAGLRILEVGCGAGWLLEQLTRLVPGNDYAGIEPSAHAAAAAREAGLDVRTGSVDTYPAKGDFDVVYSVNVVEHTADPVRFVQTLGTLAKANGQVCVICPNGAVVDAEMLFVDHLFTFSRANLHTVLARAGVRPAAWSAGHGLLAKFQEMSGVATHGTSVPEAAPDEHEALLAARKQWMEQWNELDDLLCKRLGDRKTVLCFGAGEMSDLLRAYAPRTWSRVRGFLTDRPDGASAEARTVHGLPLFYLQDTDLGRWDAVLLGTRLVHHAVLDDRLSRMGAHVIRWDDAVPGENDLAS